MRRRGFQPSSVPDLRCASDGSHGLSTLSVPSYEMVMTLLCVWVAEKIISLQRRQQAFLQGKAWSCAGSGPGPSPAWFRALIPDGGPARQHAGDSQALFHVCGPLRGRR